MNLSGIQERPTNEGSEDDVFCVAAHFFRELVSTFCFELRTIILCIITDHHSPHHQQPQTEAHIITRATHFRYLLFADGATIDDGAPQWVQRAGPTSTGQRTK